MKMHHRHERRLEITALLLAAFPLVLAAQPAPPQSMSSWPKDTNIYVRKVVAEDFAPGGRAALVSPMVLLRDTVINNTDGTLNANDTFGDSEPSIAINPANPNEIVLTGFSGSWGTNAPWWHSTNGGLTWTKRFTIPIPPGLPTGGPNDQALDYGRNDQLSGVFLKSSDGNVYSGTSTNPASSAAFNWPVSNSVAIRVNAVGAGNADQPWLLVNRDPINAAQDNLYVAYDNFSGAPDMRVAVSRGTNPPLFPTDAFVGFSTGFVNPGHRLAADPHNGYVYSLWQRRIAAGSGGSQNIDFMLNRTTNGGQSWSLNGLTNGIIVGNGDSTQPTPKFGTVNALLGGVLHAAVDPRNGDVYYVHGKRDAATSNNRLVVQRLTDNGTGGLTIGAEVFLNGQVQSALPSVAVTTNGVIGVLYDTFDGFGSNSFPMFTAHVALSTDQGSNFTDVTLYTFLSSATDNADTRQRVLGDYQQMKAQGPSLYGVFCGNGAALGRPFANHDAIFFRLDFGLDPAGSVLLSENCSPANSAIDPGELVTLDLALLNRGAATSNLVATLLPTGGVTLPDGPQTYGVVGSGATASRPFSFVANGPCGGTITATLQLQDGALNLGTASFNFTLGTVAGTNTFSQTNAALISIPDTGVATPYPSSNIVAGVPGTITKATVTISNLTHGYPADIDMLLVSPAGQKVMLMSDAGGTATPSTNLVLTATDSGHYDSTGFHDPATQNYIVGENGPTASTLHRNFFTFSIPTLPGSVVGAQLLVNTFNISTADSSETYALRQVTTPVATLTAGGSGLTGIYNDLGDGTSYGTRAFTTNESDQVIAIPLNVSAVTDIVAHAGASWAIGGLVTTLDADTNTVERLFGSSGPATNARLVLQIAVPVTLTFDDAATSGLTTTNLVNGTFKPTDYEPGDPMPVPAPAGPYGTNLSAFNGFSPNGTWQLFVFDDSAADMGAISNGWVLTLTVVTTNGCCLDPASVDLSLTNTAFPSPVLVGNNLTNRVTVSNAGPGSASNVTVSNTPPAGATFIAATPSQGTATNSGGVVIASLGSIAPNATAFVDVVVRPTVIGVLTNSARVTATENDFNLLNNTASATATAVFPTLTINNVSLSEGNTGTTNAIFTVTLSAPTLGTQQVSFATSNGTALAGSDYEATNGVLTFNPGDTNQFITVSVFGDTLYESNETFVVILSNAVNAAITNATGTGTILNDDPLPVITLTGGTVVEGNVGTTNLMFAATLSAASGLTVSAGFATSNQTAIASLDYAAKSGVLIFPPGVTTTNFNVQVTGDVTVEPDETFRVVLTAVTNATASSNLAVGTILNDDGLPGDLDHLTWSVVASPQYAGQPFALMLSALDYSNAPATNFAGTVNLSGRTGLPITTNILGTPVHTSSSSGSQTLGYSFTPTTNLTVTHVRHYYGTKVSIWTDDGVLLATQAVTSVNGTWVETPLASPLPLTAGTRYRVTVFTGGGNFYWRTDLGTNFPHGTIDQSYSRSGDFFPTTPDTARWWFAGLRYTVTPSVSVPITPVVSGNFIQGIWTGAVTVAQSGANIFLRADDNNGHPASSGYFDVVATNDLLLSVSDMPDPASLGQLINYAIVVTNTGPTTATGVVVTNRLSAAVSIASSTASQGTLATNGNEIVATFGSLGTGSNATLTVQIMSLATGVITNTTFVARAEPDGDLSNNSATNLTTVTAPAISITDVSVTEGNAGVTNAVFTVSLSSTSAASVSVSFAASNGTATAGADYAVTNGVLIFTPGQTNQTIVVGVLGDLLDETNETLFVNLSAPTNATFAKAQGTGTITDDDPAPSLSINNVSVTEGNVGATSAVFTVSLSAISGRTVTVQFATTNGSAVAPADYLSTNGLLMFAAGQTNRQIVVTVGGDIAIESNETFQVVLSSPTNATLAFAQGTNTIVNDDGLPGQLDHFVWGTINVTQVVNVPFPALITARDASNNLATNFTGPAGLFGLAATVSNQFHDGFEDGDFSDWTIGADASSRSVTNGLAAVGSNSFTMSGGFSNHYGGITHALTNLAPAWVHFRVRSAATNTAAGYFVLGTNAVASNSAVFFLMRDTGVMGLSLNSNTAPQAPYQSNTWYKISLRFNWTARQVDYYVDDALIGAAIPFRNPNPSVSNLTRVDLYNFSPGSQAWWDEIDFLGVSATFPVSIAPTNTGTFVLGAWAGLITVQQPATNLLLFAGDGNGHTNPPSFFLTVLADTDSDGIPDVYENAHGMNPNDPGDAAMDFDGDGLSNLQEYLAGTDPNDPQNFLQIISVTLSGADAQVSFTSIAGKLYRVERSDDVAGGMWITVTNNVSGTGAIVMANDPGGASPAQRTYRVRLLP